MKSLKLSTLLLPLLLVVAPSQKVNAMQPECPSNMEPRFVINDDVWPSRISRVCYPIGHMEPDQFLFGTCDSDVALGTVTFACLGTVGLKLCKHGYSVAKNAKSITAYPKAALYCATGGSLAVLSALPLAILAYGSPKDELPLIALGAIMMVNNARAQ